MEPACTDDDGNDDGKRDEASVDAFPSAVTPQVVR